MAVSLTSPGAAYQDSVIFSWTSSASLSILCLDSQGREPKHSEALVSAQVQTHKHPGCCI